MVGEQISYTDVADGESLAGVQIDSLTVNQDDRGHLMEVIRSDVETPHSHAMLYASFTDDLVLRGPHEHVQQTDLFIFLGRFAVYLWDARPQSPTYGRRQKFYTWRGRRVLIPPGVVHAYVALEGAYVLNLPDQLYKGANKQEPVDEIRYESQPNSPYQTW